MDPSNVVRVDFQARPRAVEFGPITASDLEDLASLPDRLAAEDEVATEPLPHYVDSRLVELSPHALDWSRFLVRAIKEQGGLHRRPQLVERSGRLQLFAHLWDAAEVRARFVPAYRDEHSDLWRKVLAGTLTETEQRNLAVIYGGREGAVLAERAGMTAQLILMSRCAPIGQQVADEYEAWRNRDRNRPLTPSQFTNLARHLIENRS